VSTPPNPEVALLNAALELRPEERVAYLDKACAGDADLRKRVEGLLQAHEQVGDFLETPPTGLEPAKTVRVSVPLAEKPGDKIGHYKLLQQIGEGGCGVVYMAEQEEPVRRRVALKVIKLGMDTKSVIARFEAERQALAMMDHPNIARVYDAGATATGRPYFVMELVRGIKITEFCDENKIPTQERLKLFVQVCQAIQHAHQKGIIHRDIKPSNILVMVNDGVALPKVIDFGIAKATHGRLTDQTLFTAFEQFLGTPAYMSPEQAAMTSLDIDTRSDIYSLGVLLYELLTSKTPFEQRELLAAGLDEMRRTIREKEPLKPSTRLSAMAGQELTTTASSRQTDAPKLVHTVRGDLDWIVMKCLEKDRTGRYETASGLARDIERHLHHEPVTARPPSRLYELQKTVRRHWAGFVATAAVVAALTLGTVVSTLQAVRARRAEKQQSHLREVAEQSQRVEAQQRREAEAARIEEARQRRLASEHELLARRRFYAAQMNLADQAVEAGQLGRALELLETQRPKSAAEDLRGFEWYHLWGLCNARLRVTPRGHKAPVHAVAISPDGKTLASAGDDATVRLWETSTGREGLTLQPPAVNAMFFVVAFAPDGKTIAAGNSDGLIPLWEIASGKVCATLPFLPHHWVRALAISPDGKYLVCGGDAGVLRLFDLSTEAELTTISAHEGPVLCTAFSPDGSKIATASGWGASGGTIKMWDLKNGQMEPKWKINQSAWSLAFSPDGRLFAIADGWMQILIGDTATGQFQATLRGHPSRVQSLAWLPDGKALVSCASDHTVRLWPLPRTNSVVTENRIIGEHLDGALCVAISKDGTTLASGGNDGSVKLWNVEPAEARMTAQFQIGMGSGNGALVSLCFSPDGTNVFAGMERLLAAKNIVSGQDHPVLPGAAGRGAVSPDGKLLATADSSGTVKLWGIADARLLATIKAHPTAGVELAFSPDGRILATWAFADPVLKAWDPARALTLLWATDTKTWGVGAIAFMPDSKTIAASLLDGRVAFFDASNGRPNVGFPVEGGVSGVRALAISPDGKFLAAGTDAGAAKLWNLETGRLHAVLAGHSGNVNAVAFSPDGSTIATGSEDLTVRLWDVATGQERITLKGFQSGVSALAFSSDGNILAAGSSDAWVRIWRANHVPEATAYGEQEVIDALNSLAWLLATSPQPKARNGALAVTLAKKAVVASDHKNSAVLDTLAAAHAETGNFVEAISVQKQALALEINQDLRTQYAARQALYQTNTPYRDVTQDAALLTAVAGSSDVLVDHGNFDDAELIWREILTPQIENDLSSAGLWQARGDFFGSRGLWREAAVAELKAVELEPTNHENYHILAPMLAQIGDLAGYRHCCSQILLHFSAADPPYVCERMAKDCLFVQCPGVDLAAAAKLADSAVARGQGDAYLPFFQFAKGLADYRIGNFSNAVAVLEIVAGAPVYPYRSAQANAVLAMARQRLGHTEQARAALSNGAQIFAGLSVPASGVLVGSWGDWVIANALLKEAKGLIEGQPQPATGQSQSPNSHPKPN
jgi:WD40 repeat protein/serine/threonine protein kinase